MRALAHLNQSKAGRRVGEPVCTVGDGVHARPAIDPDQFHDATSQASNCRGFGLGFLIPIARLGLLSPAEHRRVGSCGLPAVSRPVFKSSRRLSTARRALFLDVAHQVRQDLRYVPHRHVCSPSLESRSNAQEHEPKGIGSVQICVGEIQNDDR